MKKEEGRRKIMSPTQGEVTCPLPNRESTKKETMNKWITFKEMTECDSHRDKKDMKEKLERLIREKNFKDKRF